MDAITSEVYASVKLAATKFSCDELQKAIEMPDFKQLDRTKQSEILAKALVDAILVSENPSAANVKCLLDNGADPNGLPDGDRGGPLKYAYVVLEESQTKDLIIDLLLRAKASLTETLTLSLLDDAVKANDAKYVTRFLQSGAKPTEHTVLLAGALPEPHTIKKLLLQHLNAPIPKELKDVKAPTAEDFEWPTLDEIKQPEQTTTVSEELKKIMEDPILIRSNSIAPYFVTTQPDGNIVLKGNTARYASQLIELGAKWNPDQESWEIPTDAVEQAHKIVKIRYSAPVTRIEVGPSTHYKELDTEYYADALFKLGGRVWPSVYHYTAVKKYKLTPDEKKRLMDSSSISKAKDIVKGKLINRKYRPAEQDSAFFKATRAKIMQNILIRTKLMYTYVPIVSVNSSDADGYPGNTLGRHLETIRKELEDGGDSEKSIAESAKNSGLKSNNLVLAPYNKKYDVIRGNPDPETIEKIVQLGAYKTSDGRTVRGHLNTKLRGGKGWLIPVERRADTERFIFTTLPDSSKFRISAIEWIREKSRRLLKTAYIFAVIKNKEDPVVNPEAILFTVKDVYSCVDYVTTEFGIPNSEYIEMIEEFAEDKKIKVTSEAITLLWGIVGKMFQQLASTGINSYTDFRRSVATVDDCVERFAVPTTTGLSDEESLFLGGFNRLYKAFLDTQLPNTNKACMGAIAILLKMDGYRTIRGTYDAKIKEIGEQSEDILLMRTLTFKNVHVDKVVKFLKEIPLKCKILVLIALEYYINLTGEQKKKITKRLKVIY